MQEVQQPPTAPSVFSRNTQKVSISSSSSSCVPEAICFQVREFRGVLAEELSCPTMCRPQCGSRASSCQRFSCSTVTPKAAWEMHSNVGIEDSFLLPCCFPEFCSLGAPVQPLLLTEGRQNPAFLSLCLWRISLGGKEQGLP